MGPKWYNIPLATRYHCVILKSSLKLRLRSHYSRNDGDSMVTLCRSHFTLRNVPVTMGVNITVAMAATVTVVMTAIKGVIQFPHTRGQR